MRFFKIFLPSKTIPGDLQKKLSFIITKGQQNLKKQGNTVAAKRSRHMTYTYECTLTAQSFTTTEKAKNPDELMSVKAYYQLNPENDDRPERIKKQFMIVEASAAENTTPKTKTVWEELVEIAKRQSAERELLQPTTQNQTSKRH
jgi:hypothetical protein